MVGFEKALGAVKVIKDQFQHRSQSLLTQPVTTLVTKVVLLKYVKTGSRISEN